MLVQAILALFGVAEATARKLLLDVLPNGGYPGQQMTIVTTVMRAYDKMPAAARAAATTAAFAWAKRYVSSPEFAAAYQDVRTAQKPAGAAAPASVDAEVKKFIDDAMAASAEVRQMAAKMPPAEAAKLLEQIKAQEAQLKSPENLARLRAALGAGRAEETSRSEKAVTDWEANFPADPRQFVKGCLERFMTATVSVDFTLPTVWLKNATGETVGFLSPGYGGLPWEQVNAIVAGKEAVTAARMAIEAWLKELR